MMRKLENKNLVAAAIRKAASEHGIAVHELFVMPDHVHLLVVLPHGMTESEAFRVLKGRSAYLIFRHKEHMRLRYPRGHFWSVGGCAVTVGYSDYTKTRDYVRNQALAAS
jgi:putative transposase